MEKRKYNEIVQAWMTEVEKNYMQDAELTLKYCNEIIQYGQNVKDDFLIAFGHYYCGTVYYVLNDGNHFFESVTNALAYLSKLEKWAMMARCYNFLGITSTNRGNAVIAADYYQDAIELAQKDGDKDFAATIAINIGALNIICGRYKEAIETLVPVYEYFTENRENSRRGEYMLVLLSNLAKAYLFYEKLDDAGRCFREIHENYEEDDTNYAMITVLCSEAMYYHRVSDVEKRESNIARIHKATDSNVPIMDMFEDYYDYCKLLLELDREEEFWHIIDIMEPTIKTLDFTSLQLKLISLKIKFYRQKGRGAEYLQGAGLYYELSERAGQETQTMMNNVLNLRRNLQKARKENKRIIQENRLLYEKSQRDPLTGLSNRARLNEMSEEIFRRCVEEGKPLAVEILDVDDFKGYNDHYGHQQGDECLQAIAEILKSMETDHGAFAARYGGDEFIVIYEGISREQAEECGALLKEKVLEAALPFPHSKVAKVVTISQGICWQVPNEENRMWDYLHRADEMLYKTKKNKRNHYNVGGLKETETEYS